MKSGRFSSVLLAFLLSFVSPWNAYGMHGKIELEETPFGFYQNICPSNQIGGDYKKEELPTSYSIRSKMTPVKNQDPLGTCVSFTVSSCCEYYHQCLLSEAEFTILAQTDSTIGNQCTGGLPSLGKSLGVAQRYGLVKEDRLSYERYLLYVANKNNINTNGFVWKNELKKITNSSICEIGNYNKTMLDISAIPLLDKYEPIRFSNGQDLNDFSPYKLGTLYPIHHVPQSSLTPTPYRLKSTFEIGNPRNADIKAVKYQLAQGRPVACALTVFGKKNEGAVISSNWSLNYNENTVREPLLDEVNIGLHAIVLTGFDDQTSYFTLKNSWGNGWGQWNGEAFISYNYITKYSTELVAVSKQ